MTMSTRWVRPVGGGCLLLLGTWSNLYLFECPCCSALNSYFALWNFEMVGSLLLSFIIPSYMYPFPGKTNLDPRMVTCFCCIFFHSFKLFWWFRYDNVHFETSYVEIRMVYEKCTHDRACHLPQECLFQICAMTELRFPFINRIFSGQSSDNTSNIYLTVVYFVFI